MNAKTYAALAASTILLLTGAHAADAPNGGRRASQEALKPFAGLVGEWRGTGQPQRSSPKGAWRESANWAWKLGPESAALEVSFAKGKYLQSALLRPEKEQGTFALDATLADGSKRTFVGKAVKDKPFVLLAKAPEGEGPSRVSLQPLHDTRFLLLLEARNEGDAGFHRLAEVGYTREGVAFAAGESGPVCIVTEGRGTTQVTYQGKTYWVCCSGCKDLFNENPAAVLAEAAERQKAKDKGKK
jgi:YHS domain-containing protein